MEFIFRLRILIFVCGLFFFTQSHATVYLTLAQALDQVAPKNARVEKKTIFLNSAHKQSLEDELGFALDSQMVPVIDIYEQNQIKARAYIDTHTVRKDTETIMVVVSEDQKVQDILVLSFNEPVEYVLGESWLSQFKEIRKQKALQKNATVSMVLGATMTSDAIIKAVQKVLAVNDLAL